MDSTQPTKRRDGLTRAAEFHARPEEIQDLSGVPLTELVAMLDAEQAIARNSAATILWRLARLRAMAAAGEIEQAVFTDNPRILIEHEERCIALIWACPWFKIPPDSPVAFDELILGDIRIREANERAIAVGEPVVTLASRNGVTKRIIGIRKEDF